MGNEKHECERLLAGMPNNGKMLDFSPNDHFPLAKHFDIEVLSNMTQIGISQKDNYSTGYIAVNT